MAENPEETQPPRIFRKKIALLFLISAYLGVVLLFAGFYGLQIVYANRIYPGATLIGLDFSGKNWEAAAADLEMAIRSLEKTFVPIEIEGGQTFQPTLTELGVQFDLDSVLADLLAIGHGGDGLRSVVKSLAGNQSVDLAVSFDETTLQAYVDQTTASLAKKAQNTTLKVTNGQVELVPGQAGEEADAKFLKKEITSRLDNLRVTTGRPTLAPIFLEIARTQPAIPDQTAQIAQQEAQTMIGEPISMNFEGKAYTFTPADIGSWLVFKEVEEQGQKSYRPEFDEKKINASIAAKVAKPIDVAMVPKRILITTGQVIEEGREGRSLDRAQLLTEVKSLLANRSRQPLVLAASTIAKTEQQVYPEFTLGLYEGKYIELNLAKQALYAIEGQTLVGTYPVSTGKASTPTPAGTYYIANKHANPRTDQYLIREGYRLWMPYWNGLSTTTDLSGYDGYGIHELPCFNANCTRREGLRHLGTPVSHGCIRLGIGPAAFVYNWAPVGTPVYIHR